MGKKSSYPEEFDASAMGSALRRARKGAGYESMPEFCKAIEEKTGCVISRTLGYNFESGEQEIRVSQLWAISFTLYGLDGWEDGAIELMKAGYKPHHAAVEFLDVATTSFDEMRDSLGDSMQEYSAMSDADIQALLDNPGKSGREKVARFLKVCAAAGNRELYEKVQALFVLGELRHMSSSAKSQAITLAKAGVKKGAE